MMNKTWLESIEDPEIVERMVSRRDALRKGGALGTAVALGSVPVALAVFAKSAFAQGGLPQGIIDVLNFALTLEYLENEFYQTGLASGGLIPAEDQTIFSTISTHEAAHVALLQSVLGTSAVTKPNFDFTAGGSFPDAFTNYATFTTLSQAFEDTGVRAYKGQAGNLISNDDILTTALRIHSVEARHASEVRRLRGLKGWITGTEAGGAPAAVYAGTTPESNTTQLGVDTAAISTQNGYSVSAATEAFDEPLTRDEVLAIAGPFIVS